jgi:hypothetical protein
VGQVNILPDFPLDRLGLAKKALQGRFRKARARVENLSLAANAVRSALSTGESERAGLHPGRYFSGLFWVCFFDFIYYQQHGPVCF